MTPAMHARAPWWRDRRRMAALALLVALLFGLAPVAAALESDDPEPAVDRATLTTQLAASLRAGAIKAQSDLAIQQAPVLDISATLPVTTAPPTTVAPTTTAPPVTEPPAPAVPDGSVWDALAQCESGGRWDLSTGNGYFGGLQFSLSSWHAVGGTGYPHEHSREVQIEMGERLKASGGWGNWPSCSRKLGLS